MNYEIGQVFEYESRPWVPKNRPRLAASVSRSSRSGLVSFSNNST